MRIDRQVQSETNFGTTSRMPKSFNATNQAINTIVSTLNMGAVGLQNIGSDDDDEPLLSRPLIPAQPHSPSTELELMQVPNQPSISQMLSSASIPLKEQSQNIEDTQVPTGRLDEQSFQLIYKQLESQPCDHSQLFIRLFKMLEKQTAVITELTNSNNKLNAKIDSMFDNKMIISGALKRPFERVDSEEALQAVDDKAKEPEFVQACKTYWTTKFRCWQGDGQSAALNISKDMFCPQFLLKCSWSGVSRSRRTDADKCATQAPEKKTKIRFGKYENVVNLVFELTNNLDQNFDLKQTINVLSTCTRNSKAKSQQGIRTSAKKTRKPKQGDAIAVELIDGDGKALNIL